MAQDIKFKDLRQKAYLAYHQDGLIDALIGLGIAGFGVNMATDNSAFIALSWIPFILYAPLKKRITVPRLGYVKFDRERTYSIKLIMSILVGLTALAFFLGMAIFLRSDNLSTDATALLQKYHMLILGSFVAAAFVVGGALSGIKRFYLQAGLAELVLISGIELGLEPPTYVLIWGALTFLIGLGLLVQFLRQYPVAGEDGNDVF
ncbi:MAG: hypothetical protein H6667_15115 [Ardenticatenaceae bacterium]|nr:hypothetical protein [Ardenticatenaceae bacterium]MCB9444530.1 hypothetical protein [Ardenticatenaceae bacterium]